MENAKSKYHQLVLLAGIVIMVFLIIRGNDTTTAAGFGTNEPPVDSYYVLEVEEDVEQVLSLPRQILNLLFRPSAGQLRFFLRDGFAVSDIPELSVGRIGTSPRDESEEIYMLTWQPAQGFVRRDNLIHNQASETRIPPPRYINSNEPIVYLFNSHPHEMIGAPSLARYREGTVKILEFTHMIANIFADHRIPVLVEDRDVRNVLRANNWHFNDSYRASRIFVEERIHQYPSLQFFFDIHRDGVVDHVATANINGQRYARIMFVIGLENPDYHENMAMANRLNNMLEARRPGITRGIFPFYPSAAVHQNFSQDISPKMQLVEVGSAQSTVDEMIRSTQILAEVLAEYILNYLD